MASFEYACAEFALDTSTGSQVVTGVGFAPKLMMFFNVTATTTGTKHSACHSFGAADGTTQWTGSTKHGDDTTGDGWANFDARCIIIGEDGTGGYDTNAQASMTTLDSDGFTLNIDETDGTAYVVKYIALGGDDLSVDVGRVDGGNSTGNQSHTGVGFQPECMIFNSLVGNANDTDNAGAGWNVGVATAPTEEWLMSRVSFFFFGSSSTCDIGLETNACAGSSTGQGGITGEANLVSFDSDGWTWDVVNGFGTDDDVVYVALSGGGSIEFFAGVASQKTSTGTLATTGVGFQPNLLMFVSHNRDGTDSYFTSGDVGGSHGVADDSGAEHAVFDETDDGTNNAHSWNSTTKALVMATADETDATVTAEADVDSWDSDGFTLDWTTADSVERDFGFLAIGAPPSATEVVQDVIGMGVIPFGR